MNSEIRVLKFAKPFFSKEFTGHRFNSEDNGLGWIKQMHPAFSVLLIVYAVSALTVLDETGFLVVFGCSTKGQVASYTQIMQEQSNSNLFNNDLFSDVDFILFYCWTQRIRKPSEDLWTLDSDFYVKSCLYIHVISKGFKLSLQSEIKTHY